MIFFCKIFRLNEQSCQLKENNKNLNIFSRLSRKSFLKIGIGSCLFLVIFFGKKIIKKQKNNEPIAIKEKTENHIQKPGIKKEPMKIKEKPIEIKEKPMEIKEETIEIKEGKENHIKQTEIKEEPKKQKNKEPMKIKEKPIEIKEKTENHIQKPGIKKETIKIKEETIEIKEKPIEIKEETIEENCLKYIEENTSKIFYIYKQCVNSLTIINKENDSLKQDHDSIKIFKKDLENFKKNSIKIVARYLEKIYSLVIDFDSLIDLEKIILFLLNKKKLDIIQKEEDFKKYWEEYWKELGFKINEFQDLKIESKYFESKYTNFKKEIEKIEEYEKEYEELKKIGGNVNLI